MMIGTRTILFGVHQFLLHPYFVALAFRRLYGRWPDWKMLLGCLVHDLGYWGKPNLDGPEGVMHPLLGGRICDRLCGTELGDVVRFHSRKVAAMAGAPPSVLCAPDKLAMVLYPRWLYLTLGRLSGEIAEYKVQMGMAALSDVEWFDCTCGLACQWALSNVAPEFRGNVLRRFSGVAGPGVVGKTLHVAP